MQKPSMPVVVLTGGIASGKTTVSNTLQALGARIIDTDEIAKALAQPGEKGYMAMVAQLGEHYLIESGTDQPQIDRGKLRQAIFADGNLKKTLESILHPLILAEVQTELEKCRLLSDCPYAVVVIPLYAETPLDLHPDEVIVVDASPTLQRQRLMARDGIDETLANQMIQQQASREQRLSLATRVIENTGNLDDLKRQVVALDGQLRQRFLNEPNR